MESDRNIVFATVRVCSTHYLCGFSCKSGDEALVVLLCGEWCDLEKKAGIDLVALQEVDRG